MTEDQAIVAELREKAVELRRVLDDYGDRLRRMRQRNRQIEQEIGSFEGELDRLRDWLAEHLPPTDEG